MYKDEIKYLDDNWKQEINNKDKPLSFTRLEVLMLLKGYKEQLALHNVVGQSEQLHECTHKKGKKCIKPSSCSAFGCNNPI